MIEMELTLVRMQAVIDTPFRVVALFVVAVLVVVIVLNAS